MSRSDRCPDDSLPNPWDLSYTRTNDLVGHFLRIFSALPHFVSYKMSLLVFARCAPSRRKKIRITGKRRESFGAQAREMHDAEARVQLLLIASLYDKLADLAAFLVPALNAKLSDSLRVEDSTEGTDSV